MGSQIAEWQECSFSRASLHTCRSHAGAELIKPAKAPPAPLPQEALPAPRGPKKAKAAAPKAAAPPAPAKRATGSAAPSAGIRLVGDKHAGWSTVGQPKGAGAAARIFGSKGPPAGGGGVPRAARSALSTSGLTFPPGVPRPVELQVGAGSGADAAAVCWNLEAAAGCGLALCSAGSSTQVACPAGSPTATPKPLPQMCPDFLDCGECFHYRCPRAHGEVGAAGLFLCCWQ